MTWGPRWTPEKLAEMKKAGTVREHRVAEPGEALTLKIPVLGKPQKTSDGVRQLCQQIQVEKLPVPVRELRFDAVRRWRFDLAWPQKKIAVEVEGGVFTKGRHVRGAGYEADAVKYNQAQLQGWKVFRYSTGQVKKGLAMVDLRKALA